MYEGSKQICIPKSILPFTNQLNQISTFHCKFFRNSFLIISHNRVFTRNLNAQRERDKLFLLSILKYIAAFITNRALSPAFSFLCTYLCAVFNMYVLRGSKTLLFSYVQIQHMNSHILKNIPFQQLSILKKSLPNKRKKSQGGKKK